MLWIGLHLPLLSLESFASTLDAAQTARPLALEQAQGIVQADACARALGVRPGMRRATALGLAPQLLLVPACAQRDAQALRAVAHAALAFTPAVTWAAAGETAGAAHGDPNTPPTGTPGVLLEVAGSLRCFDGHAALLDRLGQALALLGHHLQVASAPTALGATLLSRWRADLALGPHSQDRRALHTLLDDAPLGLLADLLDTGAGAGAGPREAWAAMGLHTVAQLRRLPRDGLARRFGPALLLALDRARGDAPDPRGWVELPPQFNDKLELFARADTSDQLLAGARVLLARLVAWAQGQQARIARFTLLMHHERSTRHPDGVPRVSRLELALAEASLDAEHLQLLLAERLGRAPLPAPVLDLGLACEHLVRAPPPAGELFPTRASMQEGLTRLVERLQARLGRGQVQRLQPVADHRPERATVQWPADAPPPSLPLPAVAEPTLRWPEHLPLTRPVWLLRQPQPLTERDLRPCLRGRPLQVLAGPERIESGWWDGDLVARDYYIADAGDGALVWIYRLRLPLDAGQGSGWFLQGRFG